MLASEQDRSEGMAFQANTVGASEWENPLKVDLHIYKAHTKLCFAVCLECRWKLQRGFCCVGMWSLKELIIIQLGRMGILYA